MFIIFKAVYKYCRNLENTDHQNNKSTKYPSRSFPVCVFLPKYDYAVCAVL